MTTALSRNSAAYKNLSCFNVTVIDLKCSSFWEHRWMVKVKKMKGMSREDFKRRVEYFLEVEFEASEFRWTAVGGSLDNIAHCSFKSFAL